MLSIFCNFLFAGKYERILKYGYILLLNTSNFLKFEVLENLGIYDNFQRCFSLRLTLPWTVLQKFLGIISNLNVNIEFRKINSMPWRNEDVMICSNNNQLQYLNRITYESDKFINSFASSAKLGRTEKLFKIKRTKTLILWFADLPFMVYVWATSTHLNWWNKHLGFTTSNIKHIYRIAYCSQ